MTHIAQQGYFMTGEEAKYANFALMQLEQALNNLQNGMYNKEGEMHLSERWLEIFDPLLVKMIETRAMADAANKAKLTSVDWQNISDKISVV